MTPVRRAALLGVLCLACAAGAIARAQEPSGEGARAPLKMEELEVRGILEKPGRLHVPRPAQVPLPLPVRLDFYREDLVKPILPAEITNDRLPNGGAREPRNASDRRGPEDPGSRDTQAAEDGGGDRADARVSR